MFFQKKELGQINVSDLLPNGDTICELRIQQINLEKDLAYFMTFLFFK
jgi:hypothetical protein